MANRYWVGGTGNWSDTAHWSASSGGASGVSVPSETVSAADNVFFDANSFSADGQIVTLDAGTPTTGNFDCTGLDQTVTIAGSLPFKNCGGTVTLHSKLTMAFTGAWNINPYAQSGLSITRNSATLSGLTAGISITQATTQGFGTTIDFQDDFIAVNSDFTITAGFYTGFGGITTLWNSNNHTVSVKTISLVASSGFTTCGSIEANFGTSILNTNAVSLSNTGSGNVPHLTISGGSSTLNFTPVASPQSKLYYNYNSGGGWTVTWGTINVAAGAGSFLFTSTGGDPFNATTCTIDPNASVAVSVGTLTVTTLNAVGTAGNLITFSGPVSAAVANVSYVNVSSSTASGAAIPFDNRTGGVDGGSTVNWLFPADGSLPSRNSSLISAVSRVSQGLAAPSFVMGGRSASTYKLFKKATSYVYNLIRSEVFHVGHPFLVREINIPLASLPVTNTEIIPVLYFDNEQSSSVGTAINPTNYTDPTNLTMMLTADNFPDGTRGTNNFFLELQFTGSALLPVKPGRDFTIVVETEEL